jgi:hypothetical protein
MSVMRETPVRGSSPGERENSTATVGWLEGRYPTVSQRSQTPI